MNQKIILTLISAFALTSFNLHAAAPTLKSVMQGLSTAMNSLNEGIFNEDYTAIELAAAKVADHPKPKGQLPTVIKTLNIRMIKFKSIDSKVHDAAVDIVALAKVKDINGILKKHTIIMNNCVSCHTQFRTEISDALNK